MGHLSDVCAFPTTSYFLSLFARASVKTTTRVEKRLGRTLLGRGRHDPVLEDVLSFSTGLPGTAQLLGVLIPPPAPLTPWYFGFTACHTLTERLDRSTDEHEDTTNTSIS